MELVRKQNLGDRSSGIFATQRAFGFGSLNEFADFYDNFDKYDDSRLSQMFDTKGSIRKRAEQNTTEIEQQRAVINEEFAKGMIPGLKEVGKQIADEIAGGIMNITKDSVLFKGIGRNIAEGIKEYFGEAKSSQFSNSTHR